MNSSVTRTELLAFWYWTEVMSVPPRSMSKPASRSARILSSSRALVFTNSSMSGWSTSRTTIFAARRVAPPDLMVPAEASAPRMKETGPDAVPPEESSSLEERMRERLRPAPEPPLKMKPSSLYQLRIESIESSTERMKQAETCCGDGVPTLNQTGRVEREVLVHEQPGELVLEGLGVGGGREVAVVDAGLGVGLHDPVDELLEAPLADVGADGAAEVLGGDDGRGVDRPEVGELDTALLEDGLAGLPVGLDDVATLPGDLVVRVDALGAEDALDLQSALAGGCTAHGLRHGFLRSLASFLGPAGVATAHGGCWPPTWWARRVQLPHHTRRASGSARWLRVFGLDRLDRRAARSAAVSRSTRSIAISSSKSSTDSKAR